MARFWVFETQAEAQAAVDAIDQRARELFTQFDYGLDATGSIIGKRASDGAAMPDAQPTVTWWHPIQRLTDGKWIVLHTETCPAHDTVVDAAGTLVWQYVMQDVAAVAEEAAADWFPPPSIPSR